MVGNKKKTPPFYKSPKQNRMLDTSNFAQKHESIADNSSRRLKTAYRGQEYVPADPEFEELR
jgi:hypothetical protein